MNCAELRLDEYLDGELAEADRAAVDAHLSGCDACRAELERSRKLEAVLKSVQTGSAPDADRFVQSVRQRSRRPDWRPLALAAALLIGLAGLITMAHRGPVDVDAELALYAAKPSPDIEQRIKSAGPQGLAQLRQVTGRVDARGQPLGAEAAVEVAPQAHRPAVAQ